MDPSMTFNGPIRAQVAVPDIYANDSTFSFHLGNGTQRSFPSASPEKYAWLRSLGFCNNDARLRDISSSHPNTCDWFFETSQFQQWRDRTDISSHNGVLWLKGKPGVGKSTLMKRTLHHCQENFKGHVIAAYFFNARGDRLEKTLLGMLQSLLYQLLDKDPTLYEHAFHFFLEKWNTRGTKEWETELKEFLLSGIKVCQSKPVLLLIDALDECNRPDAEKVVNFLESLSISAINTKVSLNICLSSRHYPEVNMEKALELVIEERKEHHQDIAQYVKSSLKRSGKKIEADIIKKASGVFMWVVLVVALLNRAENHEAMQKTLYEVPTDIEDVFQTLLNENNSYKPETILMLQWVLFARRPLEPKELYFAVIAGTATGKLTAWNQSEITIDDIRRQITSSSRGLIEVRKGKETVQFIHESVNDFLIRNHRLQTLDPALQSNPIGTSHDRLRSCCLTYLMMEELSFVHDRSHIRQIARDHPFLAYASTYALDHAEEAQARNVLQKSFAQRLQHRHEEFERFRRFHNAFEQYPGMGCDKSVTPLYILSFHGCYELVRLLLLEKGADINAQCGIYGNALQAASVGKNEDIVALLLKNGADINAQGGYGSALQAASFYGNEKIVAMLLENGANINTYSGPYSSTLQAALVGGNRKIVTMLLKKGADVNAQGGPYSSALQAASVSGNRKIIAMLLKKGVNINAQGGLYGSALQAASVRRNKETVAILLGNGADVNAHGGLYGNALQAALLERFSNMIVAMLLGKGADVNAQGGPYGNALQAAILRRSTLGNWNDEEIVAILLGRGADVNAQGGPYGNALQAASFHGNKKIITMLLEKGANINAQGGLYGSALQAASFHGNTDIVAMLLENGADVNAQGGPFGSALQAALLCENEEIVAMLLKKGANIYNPERPCGSALQAASFCGDRMTVETLLQNGADINAKSGPYSSALQVASFYGKGEIVAILLRGGADINAQGGPYGSALQAASFCGNEEIVAMLLENGADIDATGEPYGSALQAALVGRNKGIVAMLLKEKLGIKDD